MSKEPTITNPETTTPPAQHKDPCNRPLCERHALPTGEDRHLCPSCQNPERPVKDYRAISLIQPWAWCILHAGKNIENRDWLLEGIWPRRVLIHASKAQNPHEYQRVQGVLEALEIPGLPPAEQLGYGGFVGSVLVTGVRPNRDDHDEVWAARQGYGYTLALPRAFSRIIPYRGKPGFFKVPPHVVEGIQAQLASAEGGAR